MEPHTFTNETFVELLLLYFCNGENQSKATENNTIDVLASVEVEPKLFVCQCAQASGISKNSVCRILKTNKIHSYKTRFVQELLAGDPTAQQIQQDHQFFKKIIFRTNQLLLGMDKLVGIEPIIGQKQIFTTLHMLIPNTLKTKCVAWPVLEPLLDANADLNPYFMQDGAPPHFSRIARQWLDEKFSGYLKNIVYPASTIQELEASIIRNTQNISRNTLVSIRQA
uniref:Uncharacterized protein n=1 Tax=Strigamia maritima TaxID=126957 RepID=T1JFP1_STRMM